MKFRGKTGAADRIKWFATVCLALAISSAYGQ